MAHQWIDGPYNPPCEGLMVKRRTCELCGAVQKESVVQSWGRVTGRHWFPLVGRCKPKGKK